MLRPGPAVPLERPPTVEEVIDELRARLRGDHRRSQRRTPPQCSRWSRSLPQWTTRGSLVPAPERWSERPCAFLLLTAAYRESADESALTP